MSLEAITSRNSSLRPLAAAALLFSIGPAAIMLMPMIVGVYVEELGFNNRQAGLLASVEASGMALASLLGLSWVGRINWRVVTLCALGCCVMANLAAMGVSEFMPMVFCRAIASLSSGTAFAVSVASLGEQDHTERAYGYGLAVQTFLLIIIMALSARVIAVSGIDGLFGMLALLALLVALPVAWLPAHSNKAGQPDASAQRVNARIPLMILIALLATVLHFAGTVGFWTYLERIGDSAGHPTATIGSALAWALAAGMAGALLAAWVGERWGFNWPFIFSTLLLIAALCLSVGEISVAMLALTAIVFDCMWVYANAYQAALVARLDTRGRYVVLVPAAQGAGAMLGPALAALLIKGDDYMKVNLMSGICFILSLVLFLLAVRGIKKDT